MSVVVDIGMGLEESRAAAARAAVTDGLYASVGIHPNDLTDFTADRDGCMQTLADLATEPSVVAIGETGLDLYRDRSDPALQEESFRAHIELAKEAGRTLVIHCRAAHERVLAVLDEVGAPSRTVMHCFSGDLAHAKACAERGFYCSFAGNLTYKRSTELRDAAAAVPSALLLVETDAPFLAPVPFRGKPNRPALVVHTVETLASP
jgi:TatD DNase family protein